MSPTDRVFGEEIWTRLEDEYLPSTLESFVDILVSFRREYNATLKNLALVYLMRGKLY
jgi:hypothetical protein